MTNEVSSVPATATDDATTGSGPLGATRRVPSTVERRPGIAERDPIQFLRRRRRRDNVLRFGAPILILVAWSISASVELLDRRFFPSPASIWSAFVDAVQAGSLQENLLISLRRLLIGYVVGAAVGISAGLVLGVVRPARVAIDPVISAVYTVPKLAILPLLLLIFGLGELPMIILIGLSTFFITVISTTTAVVGVPGSFTETGQSFGAGQGMMFQHIIFPAILPDIFVALRLAAGSGVLVMVGIEFVQGGEGIGWMIWNSWQLFHVERMYVGIVAVAITGAAFQGLIKFLGRKLVPWSAHDASRV